MASETACGHNLITTFAASVFTRDVSAVTSVNLCCSTTRERHTFTCTLYIVVEKHRQICINSSILSPLPTVVCAEVYMPVYKYQLYI